MTRFLIVFFSVYSLLHAFFYSRVKVLLPGKWPAHVLLILFLALMVFAPMGTRLLERGGYDVLARVSALLGYSWLGFLFYSFWGFLLIGALGIFSGWPTLLPGLLCPLSLVRARPFASLRQRL